MSKEEHLFASGLDFNHLFVLQNIDNLPEINRITGYYNILKAKGYIEDGILSSKGQEIVSLFMKKDENSENSEKEMLGISNKKDDTVENKPQTLTFSQWVAQLHKKLQEKLQELYGSKQLQLIVQGNKYPYLCGIVDLEGKIKKFIGKYRYDDLKKIESLLLKHCEIRNQKLMRYILREKGESGSDMASDYENWVKETPIENKIIKRNDFF